MSQQVGGKKTQPKVVLKFSLRILQSEHPQNKEIMQISSVRILASKTSMDRGWPLQKMIWLQTSTVLRLRHRNLNISMTI